MATPAAKAAKAKTAKAKAAEAKVPEVSMAMKKAELLEAAKKAGVKVGSKATKEQIIEAIKNASK